MNTMRLGAILGCCLLVTGCGLLESGKPARQVYLLQTPAVVASPSANSAPALVIAVSAVPGLDTDRILVLGDDARLNPVANAHWPDHMPEVFTSITRRYLSDSGLFSTVTQGSIARPDEWLLELEVQAFYGRQRAGGNTDGVILQLEGLLQCSGKDHVLRIARQTGASGDSLSGLVAAHQRVLDEAMQELPAEIIAACASAAPE
jgi:ABC-type uncharacterized transport system auxiliary subunit